MILSGKILWNYKLSDGKCFDSMAMHTARLCGISEDIIKRANEFRGAYDMIYTLPSDKAIENDQIIPPVESFIRIHYTMDEILAHMKRIYAPTDPVIVDYNQQPPITLEGQSCVYILLMSSFTSKTLPDQIYIGETESISQRLIQHRRRMKDHHVRALTIKVSNKSDARKIEAAFIQEFTKEGYNVVRSSDADNVLFSSNISFN